MYIMINKEWFEKNKAKFEKQSDQKDSYMITTDYYAELMELDKGVISIKEDITKTNFESDLYVSLDWKPNPDNIVALVEDAIDDIKGDAFAKIIEVVVKKLNKFKSLIESVRGL